jgi:hypothetical protein
MDYSKLKVPELKVLCRKRGMKGCSGLSKPDLIKILKASDDPLKLEIEGKVEPSMEEYDIGVGYWLKDIPYIFEAGKTPEESRRTYFNISRESLAEIFSDELGSRCEMVEKYFWVETFVGSKGQLFVNGRAMYFIDQEYIPSLENSVLTVQPNLPLDQHTPLTRELYPFYDIEFDLSSIICSRTGNTQGWPNILELIKNCPTTSSCDPCTVIGRKIARSLIRIASVRIFSDPTQSIMELPVNSIDAYRPDRKIGKFGMGFFSIFYWLVGHPKRSLTIESFYRDQEGRYGAYKAIIYENEAGVLAFRLQPVPYSEVTQTGVRIAIDASQDKFDYETVMGMERQIEKLRLVDGVSIYGKIFANQKYLTLWSSSKTATGKDVFCILDPSKIVIEDRAIGIPLELLLGALFVPSISTKTIALSTSIVEVVVSSYRSRILDSTFQTSFEIAVGGIIILKFQNDKTNWPKTFLLDLPINTRLPVSRDDIILAGDTPRIVEQELLSLLNQSADQLGDVSDLQDLITQYIKQTASLENKNLFESILQTFYKQNVGKLVPQGYDFYAFVPGKYVASKKYDVLEVQRSLEKNVKLDPRLQVWYGMSVIPVIDSAMNGKQISSGGLPNYLFIAKSYLESLGAFSDSPSSWIDTITNSYVDTKLYPKNVEFEKDAFETFDKEYNISVLITNNDHKLLLYSLFFKLKALEASFVLGDMSPLIIGILDYYRYDPAGFHHVVLALLAKLGKLKGNQTYGGSKYTMGFDTEIHQPYQVSPMFRTKKWKDYCVQFYLCKIESIKEHGNCIVSLTNVNSVAYMFLIIETWPPGGRKYIELCYAKSATYMEFFTLIVGFGIVFNRDTVTLPIGIEIYIEEALKTIRADNTATIKDVALHLELWGRHQYNNPSMLYFSYMIDYQRFAKNWEKSSKHTSNIPTENISKHMGDRDTSDPKVTSTILLNDLIGKLFVYPVPKEGNLFPFLKEISEKPKIELPLQITEIAVNEGTTKSFIPAVLTELVQNSIDAIRTSKTKPDTVWINVTKLHDDSNKTTHILLSILDLVGMNEDAFLHVGIPFLSTKTPSEIVTGEMGSGFFNAYRESDMVTIGSTKNGTLRKSIDVPIRNESGRVTDIKKKYLTGASVAGYNSTIISIRIPVADEYDYIKKLTEIESYTKNVIALALHASISYQNINVTVQKELVFSYGGFSVYRTPDDSASPSYITTKGIPFAPLETLFDRFFGDQYKNLYLNTNLIVDLPGGYTPSQSRSKIRIDPEVEKNLETVALYCAFYAALHKTNTGFLSIVDHMLSTGSAAQLYFSAYFMKSPDKIRDASPYAKYVKFMGKPALYELINTCITQMRDERYEKVEPKIKRVLNGYDTGFPVINKEMKDITIKWLIPKNQTGIAKPAKQAKSKSSSLSKIQTGAETPIKRDPLELLVEKWIRAFWITARKAKVNGFERDVPRVVVGVSEELSHISGRYLQEKHMILINATTWTREDAQLIRSTLEKKDLAIINRDLKKCTVWQKFFAYSFPATTIPHEIEHARRNANHDSSGGHDSLNNISLFPGDPPSTRTFDEGVNAIYQYVLANGMYREFFA